MMRRIFACLAGVLVLCSGAAAYAAWPLWTAAAIREAVKAGNSAYLDSVIVWPSVKKSLRDSLIVLALGAPGGAVSPASGTSVPGAPPGFWGRVKAFASLQAVDSLVETYATPEGLPKLFSYGRTWREKIRGVPDPDAGLPFFARLSRAWGRVKRAVFTSFTRFEIEVADKYTPERHYDGILELSGLSWKLTELRVKTVAEPAPQTAMP